MNDASNFPENEQSEAENTSAQADAENTAAQGRVCPQCGAALEPGASCCTSCGAKIDDSEDVTYHIVRPEAERSYEDANFHPSDDAGSTPPRYYTPNDDAWAEKPKHKHHPRKPKTVRTPEQKRLITRIACLCLVCALLGGLGGICYILAGVSEWRFENGVAGFGFLALAVMIFGQWKPWRIALAALLFGLFRALSNVYVGFDFLKALNIPGPVYNMMPYIISLIVLAFTSKRSRAPKAEGIPYDKGTR